MRGFFRSLKTKRGQSDVHKILNPPTAAKFAAVFYQAPPRTMGIETVAVYSDADAQGVCTSEMADEGASTSALPARHPVPISYRQIMEAVKKSGGSRCASGYGFLVEKLQFAEALCPLRASPCPAACRRDREDGRPRSTSKKIAQEAGVSPCPVTMGLIR